jgi:hypothetical protein
MRNHAVRHSSSDLRKYDHPPGASALWSCSDRCKLPPPYIKPTRLFVSGVMQPNDISNAFWQIETTNINID